MRCSIKGKLRFWLPSLVLFAWATSLAAQNIPPPSDQDDPRPTAQVAMVTEHQSVAPGETTTLAAVLTMKPGWHTYWRYPGEAGIPTRIQVNSPLASVGDITWPAPMQFGQPGGIVGYGYEEEVLLAVPLTISASLPAGSRLHLPVKVDWLSCKHVCIREEAEASVMLDIGEPQVDPTALQLLSNWQPRVPVPAESVAVQTSHETQGDLVTVTARWPESPGQVSAYPAPGSDLLVTPQGVVQPDPQTTRAQFQVEAIGAATDFDVVFVPEIGTPVAYSFSYLPHGDDPDA